MSLSSEKEIVRMFFKYKKNNSSLKNISYKLKKEFSTDGVTLSVKARLHFLDEKHLVNEAVEFPVALLENTKLTLIKKIFVTVRL